MTCIIMEDGGTYVRVGGRGGVGRERGKRCEQACDRVMRETMNEK